MNRLMMKAILEQVRAVLANDQAPVNATLLEAFGAIIDDVNLSPAFRAVAMELPSERAVADAMPIIDPAAIHRAREIVREALGIRWHSKLVSVIDGCRLEGEYSPDSTSAGIRALKEHLLLLRRRRRQQDDGAARSRPVQHGQQPDGPPRRAQHDRRLEHADQERHHRLGAQGVVLRAASRQQVADDSGDRPVLCGRGPVVTRVSELANSPFFSMANPNNVYALLVAFFMNNPAEFHRLDGEGYKFWVECVLKLDALNPQVASRVARSLENWRRYTPQLSNLMFQALKHLERQEKLSVSVREIVEKALNNPA